MAVMLVMYFFLVAINSTKIVYPLFAPMTSRNVSEGQGQT